jgi:hypothetical protein
VKGNRRLYLSQAMYRNKIATVTYNWSHLYYSPLICCVSTLLFTMLDGIQFSFPFMGVCVCCFLFFLFVLWFIFTPHTLLIDIFNEPSVDPASYRHGNKVGGIKPVLWAQSVPLSGLLQSWRQTSRIYNVKSFISIICFNPYTLGSSLVNISICSKNNDSCHM